MSDEPEPPLDRAETRARELLELWSTHEPATSERFAVVVVRRARQQRAFVRPLRLVGEVLSATLAVARGLLRPSDGRPR